MQIFGLILALNWYIYTIALRCNIKAKYQSFLHTNKKFWKLSNKYCCNQFKYCYNSFKYCYNYFKYCYKCFKYCMINSNILTIAPNIVTIPSNFQTIIKISLAVMQVIIIHLIDIWIIKEQAAKVSRADCDIPKSSNLIQSDPIWSKLIQSDPIWSNMMHSSMVH